MRNLGQSRLRVGRAHLDGHFYHVTSVTKNRTPIFTNFQLARQLVQCLRNSDVSSNTETQCFCVMPDHFHWLLKLNGSSLSQAVSRVKSEFSRRTGLKVWQDGFHDHGIRFDESLVNVARYIVANPLRGELVNYIGDYPHWDSVWL